MKPIGRFMILLLGVVATTEAGWHDNTPPPPVVKALPVFDEPMQDVSVCRGPDGTYFMTATVTAKVSGKCRPMDKAQARATRKETPPDFATNDGVYLWKSPDLKQWTFVGQVWSIEKDAAKDSWQRRQAKPRGMIAPEIHYLKNTYWIAYSMNGAGTGLLKSKTGKAEGPYEDMGRITSEGGGASVFADDDGSVYWLMDAGWIAKMKDDLTGLAERPRLLEPKADCEIGDTPYQVGRRGAFLFKKDKVYYLVCADYNGRLDTACDDSFVAYADNVYGPYSERHLMTAHSGQTTVFDDGAGNFYCTWAGHDTRADSRNRPGIVPLAWTNYDIYFGNTKKPFPRKPAQAATERGCWDEITPIHYSLRDMWAVSAPDGYVYQTGSMMDERLKKRLLLFRTKDGGKHWEERQIYSFDEIPWLDKGLTDRGKGAIANAFMDSYVCYFNNTFYVTSGLYGLKGQPDTRDGGKTFTSGSICIKSKSGTWEGPWEFVARYGHQQFYFAGHDGTIYGGMGRPYEMLPDLTGRPGGLSPVANRDQSPWLFEDGSHPSDDGNTMTYFLDGRYCRIGCSWNGPASLHFEKRHYGTYDMQYSWADKLEGPYSRARAGSIHGNGRIVKDAQGRYWSTFFSNDCTAPYEGNWGGLYPVTIDKSAPEWRVDIADEWPKD